MPVEFTVVCLQASWDDIPHLVRRVQQWTRQQTRPPDRLFVSMIGSPRQCPSTRQWFSKAVRASTTLRSHRQLARGVSAARAGADPPPPTPPQQRSAARAGVAVLSNDVTGAAILHTSDETSDCRSTFPWLWRLAQRLEPVLPQFTGLIVSDRWPPRRLLTTADPPRTAVFCADVSLEPAPHHIATVVLALERAARSAGHGRIVTAVRRTSSRRAFWRASPPSSWSAEDAAAAATPAALLPPANPLPALPDAALLSSLLFGGPPFHRLLRARYDGVTASIPPERLVLLTAVSAEPLDMPGTVAVTARARHGRRSTVVGAPQASPRKARRARNHLAQQLRASRLRQQMVRDKLHPPWTWLVGVMLLLLFSIALFALQPISFQFGTFSRTKIKLDY